MLLQLRGLASAPRQSLCGLNAELKHSLIVSCLLASLDRKLQDFQKYEILIHLITSLQCHCQQLCYYYRNLIAKYFRISLVISQESNLLTQAWF